MFHTISNFVKSVSCYQNHLSGNLTICVRGEQFLTFRFDDFDLNFEFKSLMQRRKSEGIWFLSHCIAQNRVRERKSKKL